MLLLLQGAGAGGPVAPPLDLPPFSVEESAGDWLVDEGASDWTVAEGS